ncbi:MAG TPA: sigma-70 family RNA polymerase sigma factor [Terriglobia bacterium]|nr:sigma-70 family RNA polymerase sigma factor [Terriglobia bacterium]
MSASQPAGLALERAFPATTEEALFVRELQAGSEEAFTVLLEAYQHPVFNLIAHIVENSTDAADVLQDVFLKVFRGIRHFHGDSSLKTWIYRIAVHEASNHRRGWIRRRRREPFSLDERTTQPVVSLAEDRGETPYQALEHSERQALVKRALASLSQPYRTVVVLREIEGLSYEEIAKVLGVAEGTVKSRLMRGRELLRRKMVRLGVQG